MVQLVFHTAFLGDLLLSIPFLRHLKQKWPDRPLVLVCRPGLGSFFLENKLVDDFFELDKKSKASVSQFLEFAKNKEIENIFCPHQSFHSAWILKKLKAKKKVAYSLWWNALFFDTRLRRPDHLPEVLRVLELLTPFDLELNAKLEKIKIDKNNFNSKQRSKIENWPSAIPSDFTLRVAPGIRRAQVVLQKFDLQQPFAIVAPSSQWATKRWTTSGFSELIQVLRNRGLHVYLVGGKSEVEQCLEIETRTHQLKTEKVLRSLAGETDLLNLHAILSHAEIVIANDSGSMHMAAVAGRPVVGIFGPTTLELGYRPWMDESYIAQIDIKCRPCGSHGHVACPIKTHDCMKKITARDVIEGVDVLRKKTSSVTLS